MTGMTAMSPTQDEDEDAALSRGEQLVRALQSQRGARLIETHISWVLLAGEQAWKIKKPLRLSFVDFGTLERRRLMCSEELRLNQRLAPSLYLGVVDITGTPQAPVLAGSGAAIEVALRMRRFPDGALLSERLAAHTLDADLIDRLASRLARFHAAAAPVDASEPFGRPEAVDAEMRAVIEGLATRGAPGMAAWLDWARERAQAQAPAWAARRATGQVREGHGDLHLANTVAMDGEVTAFDGIEFNPALRWIDVQADIAFLVMDLHAQGRADLAFRCLDRYLAAGGDHAGLTVLRYYLAYRALVRAMVALIERPGRPSTPDYMSAALHWRSPGRARLLITHGLSGSGKSHAAARLLERAGAIRLRSDVERKRLHGLDALADSTSVPGGIYGSAATERTYERLRELAAIALDAGWPVIVDAAFLQADQRADFEALARARQVPFTILDCQAPRALLEQRLAARVAQTDEVSEADAQVLQQQLQTAQPLTPREQTLAIEVDTRRDFDAAGCAALWAAR
jgi:aminoglycoside phosphotransferase family enzyme/predicted kinase